jgi:hypothetical protein
MDFNPMLGTDVNHMQRVVRIQEALTTLRFTINLAFLYRRHGECPNNR